MKRLIPILIIAISVLLAQLAYAQEGGHGEEPEGAAGGEDEFAAEQGAAVYAGFCQACHGPQGEAKGTGPAFAAITYDPDTAREAISAGREGDEAAMLAYAEDAGGVLTETQIDHLLAYMATWGTGETPPLPSPNIGEIEAAAGGSFGDPRAGAVVYATTCYGCHGLQGEGHGEPDFPPFEQTNDSLRVVREGAESPYMPAFAAANGGPLTDQQLADLDAYLATWPVAAADDGTDHPEGVNVLVIVMGIAGIVVVGAAYMTAVVSTET